jgi:Membrane dipeptidase (Peptidase family M19)
MGVRLPGTKSGATETGSDVTTSFWFDGRISTSTRRRFLASGASALALAGLRVPAARAQQSSGARPTVTARQLLTGTLTIDMHTHAGRFIRDNTAFEPVDHVGLGTDMRGLTGPSVLDDYRDLPLLTEKLLARGFAAVDVGKIVGGNYARVFAATVG